MTEKNIILLLLFFKDFLFFDVDRFWSLYSTCYNIVPVLLFWLRGVWNLSSPTRDGICTPCFGRRSPKHWTTREVPGKKFEFLVWAIAGKTSSKTEGVAGTYYGFLAHCRKKKKKMLWQGCLFDLPLKKTSWFWCVKRWESWIMNVWNLHGSKEKSHYE